MDHFGLREKLNHEGHEVSRGKAFAGESWNLACFPEFVTIGIHLV
jgi:hypothetical protein